MAEVEYSSRAADWLREADPDVREQVMGRLEQARDFPDHFLMRLSDSPYYRLRAGDHRAIVDWKRNENPEVLFVRTIGHRRNVYDWIEWTTIPETIQIFVLFLHFGR